MKIINIKRKTLIRMFAFMIFVIIICGFVTSFSMQNYYKVDFSTGLVTATTLNVRSGPGTEYKIVATANKNDYIRVFAGVGDWYIVQVQGDYIGAVNKKYIKPIYPTSNNANKTDTENKTNLTADELEVFNLINNQRTNNGLAALKIDPEVQNVARIKAQDMVNNNYFSHTSPTYGTPFKMLDKFKVTYSTAGENIAGNSSNSGAVNAWMNSPGHKANILNSKFDYTGIGVVNSPKYGKIYVQMFIGK